MDVLPALYALMLFMLIGAIIAVETRDLLSSVLCLGAVGLALAVIDLVLKAPDLALTQVVVEIFAVVLLIRIVVRREDTTREFVSDTLHVAFVGGLLVAIVLASFYCLAELRPFGSPLMAGELEEFIVARSKGLEAPVPELETMGAQYLRHAFRPSGGPRATAGVANQVTAVLLDFRAYDTLGEAAVIFAAIMGCYALLRTRGKKGEITSAGQ